MANETYVGPLETLLQDNAVMEIMINRFDEIYIEKHGQLELTDSKFDNEGHLLQTLRGILNANGQEINEINPIVDTRLPDGTLMNVVIPPVAVDGTFATMRKFGQNELDMDDLIRFGSLTEELAIFLKACVKARLNIVVSGGTGSGKTTVFNNLTQYFDDDERIVVAEARTELRVRHPHVVRMSARFPKADGTGEVTVRDLVINALKMRPERLVVGEVHGGEVLDIFQAMNTGHDGSMFTIHANSPRDALARMEIMASMASPDVPLLGIREQMASAIDMIVQQTRLRDGSRKIVQVTEVMNIEGNMITMQDIFEFEQTGFEDGKVHGQISSTGIVPTFMPRMQEYIPDLPFDENLFTSTGQNTE